jgi:hypothetical protein
MKKLNFQSPAKNILTAPVSADKNVRKCSAFYIRFIILTTMICTLFFQSCDIPVLVNEPTAVPYRTEHFVIYYYDCFLTPSTIENIGIIKERLLESINAYLETDYNRIIEVFITDTVENSYASDEEQVYERVDYVLTDDGHEMAHIVSIQEWGHPLPSFLVEGIAVAAEVRRDGSAFSRYQNTIKRMKKNNPDYLEIELERMKICLERNNWYTSYEEYEQAGAFIHFLKAEFGIKKVKDWYQSCIVETGVIVPAGTFSKIFKISLDSVIDKFEYALVSGKAY